MLLSSTPRTGNCGANGGVEREREASGCLVCSWAATAKECWPQGVVYF